MSTVALILKLNKNWQLFRDQKYCFLTVFCNISDFMKEGEGYLTKWLWCEFVILFITFHVGEKHKLLRAFSGTTANLQDLAGSKKSHKQNRQTTIPPHPRKNLKTQPNKKAATHTKPAGFIAETSCFGVAVFLKARSYACFHIERVRS